MKNPIGHLAVAVSLVALLIVAGCGSHSSPAAPERAAGLTGAWSGSGSGLTMSLALTESGSQFSGTGYMSGGGSLACSVAGTYVEPNISMTIHVTGYEDSNFTGRFSDANTISGKMNGSGFVDEAVVFVRQ